MTGFKWLKSPNFKFIIADRVNTKVLNHGMRYYDVRIVEKLFDYVQQNKTQIIAKAISHPQQRKIFDAINSIDRVMEEACTIARTDNRDTVTIDDFNTAYQNKFCMIWPFCS